MVAVARDMARALLDRAGIPLGGDAPHALHVHDDRLWARVLAERNLGFGEAYMDGWWDCDALDRLFERILAAGIDQAVTPSPPLLGRLVRRAQLTVTNPQSPRRAARNASHHYDIGNELYQTMLDKRMVYSCGYWAEAEDLDSAQEAKLDLVCRKLELRPGVRVLDIGCGWGGFAQFAAERYGARVVGISPAAEQVAVARERCAGLPVEILRTDYRAVRGVFDRIVSIGMLEHVGPRNLRRFFDVCDALLTRDGIMLHHTIGSLVSNRRLDPWFERYVFPGGALPSMARLARAAEPGWVIEDVQNLGPDYDRTLMAWLANVEAAWPRLPAYDERFQRMWRYYLASCAAGFRVRQLQLWQLVMRRPGPASRYQAAR